MQKTVLLGLGLLGLGNKSQTWVYPNYYSFPSKTLKKRFNRVWVRSKSVEKEQQIIYRKINLFVFSNQKVFRKNLQRGAKKTSTSSSSTPASTNNLLATQ